MEEIELNHICKIEGHASLKLIIEKGKVKECNLEALEGARFFEALVLGKKVEDVQEIISRICGICSCSHSVACIEALENAAKIKPSEKEKAIREIILNGERIRSHATHLYFLVLPDYMKASSLLATNDTEKINDAIEIIKAGNKIVEGLAGREMHPFVKLRNDKKRDYEDLKRELKKAKPLVIKTLKLFAGIRYPEFERETNFLAMRGSDYEAMAGNVFSNLGKINTSDYSKHIKEGIKQYATSKFVLYDDKPYLVGASSRVVVNADRLDEETKGIIKELGIKFPSKNPFHNNIAQAVELLYLFNRTLKLLDSLDDYKDEDKEIKIKPGRGVSALEAPRGTLFHEYEINEEGKISYCNIITPTAQNLNQMEIDIKNYVNTLIENKMHKDNITLEIEKLIRAYDPCFSCSTHFLEVEWVGS